MSDSYEVVARFPAPGGGPGGHTIYSFTVDRFAADRIAAGHADAPAPVTDQPEPNVSVPNASEPNESKPNESKPNESKPNEPAGLPRDLRLVRSLRGLRYRGRHSAGIAKVEAI